MFSTSSGKQKKAYNILLLDDDKMFLDIFARMFWGLNIVPSIRKCAQGAEAIEYLSQNARSVAILPDIMFVDINMPEMDGWQFLTNYGLIKSTLDKKPVIFTLSASAEEQDLDMLRIFPDVKKSDQAC